MSKQNKAALCALLSGIVWSFSGLFSRMVAWSSFSLVGLRSVTAVLILGLFRGGFRIRPNRGLWISAAGITATSLLYMSALRLTTTSNAIVLQYTASVFVILYMILIKKQKPLKSEMIAAFFVILGVCLCFSEGLGGGRLAGNLLALASGVSYAAVFLSTRYSPNDPVDSVYFGTLISCAFIVFPFFDPAVSLTPRQLLMAVALGASLGLGYLFFSLGLRYGLSAVRSCVISNVEPVMNPVWVFLFRGESPGPLGILGAAVVLLSVTAQSLYEAKKESGSKA